MIAFRFDIDTHRGLVRRTPPLLDVLERHAIPATFFCVMGREASVPEIVRLRFLAPKTSKSKLDVAAKGGLASLVAAALLPRYVGSGNPKAVRAIVDRGHEVQPHGWSHIRWQRDIDRIDVREHLRLAMDACEAATGERPVGYASPGRTWNDAALDAFDDAGLLYAGDMDGDAPFRPEGHDHWQLPITRFETIAQLRARGLDDDAIVDLLVADVEGDGYRCLYEHPDDLGEAELDVFDRLFAHVRGKGIETATLSQVAAACPG